MAPIPLQTLYVQGLNDKISKKDLKISLYALFSIHGRVIDVVALKTIKGRGQAFVVFDDLEGANAALRALQGFPLFEKGLRIQYSRTESNIIKIRNGTVLERKRRMDDNDDDEIAKRAKLTVDEESNQLLFLTNLPLETTKATLEALFSSYPGFKEVRLIPGKRDIGFVEYESNVQAQTVKNVLDGYEIEPDHPISVAFAQK